MDFSTRRYCVQTNPEAHPVSCKVDISVPSTGLK